MNQKMPQKIFFRISKSLSSADPTWALFVANEYLEQNDPLRKALLLKIENVGDSNTLLQAAYSGKRLKDLSPKQQQQLRRAKTHLYRQTTPLPSPRRRQSLHRSMAQNDSAARRAQQSV